MLRLRRIMLRLAVVFTRLHSGLAVSDTHNGLRLFTRAAALRLRITQPRMAHASEILAQIGPCGSASPRRLLPCDTPSIRSVKDSSISGMFRVLADIFYARWTR